MGTQTPERAEARAAVEKAILNYIRVALKENAGEEDPVLQSWAVMTEYTSPTLAPDDLSGTLQIVMDGQMISTSVGLFKIGERSF